MLGLDAPGARVWLSKSDNPKRKLAHSWELVETDLGEGRTLVGINTSHPNGLVAEAILSGIVAPLAGYDTMRREVRYGKNSRIDILLESEGQAPCYVEVKNVHLMRKAGHAEFPDCVTARGAKHLVELGDMVEAGYRAVMVFLIQRADARRFSLAADLDPFYASSFAEATTRGVETYALDCTLTPQAITPRRLVEMV